jgi:hypothetical protein
MNKNRQFDEHIKDQFSNYTADIHPRIWENIIAERDKKRPAGFWILMFNNRNKLLLSGLIITLGIGGALSYYSKNISSKDYKLTETGIDRVNNKTENKTGRLTNKPSGNQVPNSGGIAGNVPAFDNTVNTNPALFVNSKLKSDISAPLSESDGAVTQTGKGNKKYYTGLGNVLINITTPYLEEDVNKETGGTLLGRLTFNAEKITEERRTGKKETLRFNPVIFLPDCPSLEKDAAGNKTYFELYGGPDYAFRSLHDTANSAYLQKRKESTRFKTGFSAGVRYTRVFKNSMSVRTGVNYSQINEKFTFNQGNIVQVTYIINNNGDTIGSYTTTGSRHKTTINRYRSVDIPVVIGYELGNGKLHANINAGAVVNIYSWQKGDVMDMNGNPVTITTGKSPSKYQFKTNAGIGFIGAVSVYYKLNDRLHIMAEPYFRYNLSQMNKEEITLKQKYHTAGLRLGIRLDLK